MGRPTWAAPRDQIERKDKHVMDGSRFDQLIKSITTTRVSRLTALRGLAVGALAAASGVAAPADDAAAKKKSCPACKKKTCKRKGDKKKCNCRKNKPNGTLCSIPGATTTTTCQSGTCVAGATPTPTPTTTPAPVPGFSCTSDTQCPQRFQACFSNACGACNKAGDCKD